MKLYLFQHGDSVSEAVDRERPLSETGRADIGRLAAWLERNNVRVGAMLHSGKTRARQTAEILQPVLSRGGVLRQAEGLAPNDPPRAVLDLLRGQDQDLAVVSHLPLVGRLVSLLLADDPDREPIRFRPGSLAVLVRDDTGVWRLDLFVTPGFY